MCLRLRCLAFQQWSSGGNVEEELLFFLFARLYLLKTNPPSQPHFVSTQLSPPPCPPLFSPPSPFLLLKIQPANPNLPFTQPCVEVHIGGLTHHWQATALACYW